MVNVKLKLVRAGGRFLAFTDCFDNYILVDAINKRIIHNNSVFIDSVIYRELFNKF